MYEKFELERLKIESERMKFENERNEKEFRFRCLEIARSFSTDLESLLADSKKISDFVSSK